MGLDSVDAYFAVGGVLAGGVVEWVHLTILFSICFITRCRLTHSVLNLTVGMLSQRRAILDSLRCDCCESKSYVQMRLVSLESVK